MLYKTTISHKAGYTKCSLNSKLALQNVDWTGSWLYKTSIGQKAGSTKRRLNRKLALQNVDWSGSWLYIQNVNWTERWRELHWRTTLQKVIAQKAVHITNNIASAKRRLHRKSTICTLNERTVVYWKFYLQCTQNVDALKKIDRNQKVDFTKRNLQICF